MSAQSMILISPDELDERIATAVARGIAKATPAASAILTREQVAELLNVHPQIVTRFVRNDGLVGMKLGSTWRFRRADVEAWLADRAVRPGAHAEKQGKKLRNMKATG